MQEKLIADGLHMLSEYRGQEGILRVINEFIVTATRNEKYQKRLFEIQEEFLNGFHDLLKKGVELVLCHNMQLKKTRIH